jgi:subtilase family serine protease
MGAGPMLHSTKTSPRRAFLTAARVGVVAAALICVSASVASAARWPQKRLTAAPVNSASISTQLKHVTGYTASQLSARPICGAPKPGSFGCFAQVVTLPGSSDGVALLHLSHVKPMRTTNRPTVRPTVTEPTGVQAPTAFTPAYMQWAYDLSYLSATKGATDTVAIVDAYDDPNAYTDMESYRSTYGLPALQKCGGTVTTSCFTEVNQAGTATPLPNQPNAANASWNLEESLDLDAVSALCPLCKILYVEANNASNNNLKTAVGTAAQMGANQISMSWGSDTAADPSQVSQWSSLFRSAFPLAAVGDNSYPGPLGYSDTQYAGDSPNMDVVGYPAALSTVTAVGGTSLAQAPIGTSNARGFGESTWAIDTPCSFQPNTSSSCSGSESGCDITQATPLYEQNNNAIISACDATATSIGATPSGGRAYSDVSADANPNTGLAVYDSLPFPYSCGARNNLCLAGGTSLATPLTAAFEALTGTAGGSPAWAYTDDAAYLNDIVSGSDGACPSGAFLICNAGSGWDGPTGNGSISGDVVSGAPGIGGASETAGGSTTSPTATLSGGVFPNGLDTQYWWEYGTDTTYSNPATSTVDVGSGKLLTSAAGLLTGLTPCAKYHYRLDASNTMGTTYGYDNTFIAGTSAPSNITAPTITGTAEVGDVLTAQQGTWSPTACSNPSVSYQWQESTSPNGPFTDISNAIGSTYTPISTDESMYITVNVTESNSGGSGSATASAVGPVTTPVVHVITATTTTTTTTTTTPPTQTGTVVSPPTPAPTTTTAGSTTTVQFYRCAHKCTKIDTHGASTYKLGPADNGMYVEIKVTTTTPGSKPIVTTRWIGPVTAPSAGAATIARAARVASNLTITGTKHAVLAHVLVSHRTTKAVTLSVTPQGKKRTKIWAYVVKNGDVMSCTVSHTLKGRLKMNVSLKSGQTLKLVAVQG